MMLLLYVYNFRLKPSNLYINYYLIHGNVKNSQNNESIFKFTPYFRDGAKIFLLIFRLQQTQLAAKVLGNI